MMRYTDWGNRFRFSNCQNAYNIVETAKIVLHRKALTKSENGAIIIKLSTRETEKRAKERRKLRDKRTSDRLVQKTVTQKNSKKNIAKVLDKRVKM